MATIRKPMTATEKELFKETVIKDYRLKHKGESRREFIDKILKKLKLWFPLEAFIGVSAAVLLVYLNGFQALVNLLLMGIIWATIISAILALFIKAK
jgi:ABC-type Fe3+-siderophore transport system permease subunit